MNYNELVNIPSMEQLDHFVKLANTITESITDASVMADVDIDWDRSQTPPVFTVRFLLYCDSADVREMFKSMGATESVTKMDEEYYHKYLHVFRLGNIKFRIFDNSEEVM